MERDKSSEFQRRISLDNKVVNNDLKAINLEELISQTNSGLRSDDWEVYSMVVVGDAGRLTTFYKQFTHDGKVTVIKDKEGQLSRSEYDFEYARSINEMNLQITPPSEFNRVYTPAISYVSKDENGNENEYGIQNLAKEFRSRFEKIQRQKNSLRYSEWDNTAWQGEEVSAEEKAELEGRLFLRTQEIDDRNIRSVISGRPRMIYKPDVAEGQLTLDSVAEAEARNDKDSEGLGVAGIIAATAVALEKQFEIEREKDKKEFDRRLSEQKQQFEEVIGKQNETIDVLTVRLNELEAENARLRQANEEQKSVQSGAGLTEVSSPKAAEVENGNGSSPAKEFEIVSAPVAVATVGSSPLAEADYSWPEDPYRVRVVISESIPVSVNESENRNGNGSERENTPVKTMFNGAVKGKDGKFTSIKEYSVDENELDKTGIKEAIPEMNYMYELSNGWRISFPRQLKNKAEVLGLVEEVFNSWNPLQQDLVWLEDKIKKEIKRIRKTYTRNMINQVKLVPPSVKKEE